MPEPIKIAINGFGRIGRNILRAIAEGQNGQGPDDRFEITAFNDLADLDTLAHLFKYDSVYGVFKGTIRTEGDSIILNDRKIQVFKKRDPREINWPDGTWCVVEASGVFRDPASASAHLQHNSVEKVVITAPGKESQPESMEKYRWVSPLVDGTFVMGVNNELYDPKKHNIVSNASCTTNCLAPIAKILHDKFGIKHGFMTTVHSLTNDQRILDFPHADLRRARAAGVNLIPTTTGAARAVGIVIPDLKGKLDGGAVRVPTIDGSLVDLTVVLNEEVTEEIINKAMKDASESEQMKGILQYSTDPLVSSDIIRNPHSSIFDSLLTRVMDKTFVKLLSWYDNEWGYSCRVLDLAQYMASKEA